jgi:hypothetical protein
VKKLMGKNDVEDALKRLDALTQEEARMATAEVLKITHAVDDKVTALIDGAKLAFLHILGLLSIGWLGGKVAKDVDEEKSSSSSSDICSRSLNPSIGDQLREKLQKWLSPPDPSTNHNIARKVHHEGTSTWFFQGGMFQEWKSSPSLLWIHGKRTPHRLSLLHPPCLTLVFIAGSGKSILWFVISFRCFLRRLNSSQFWDN